MVGAGVGTLRYWFNTTQEAVMALYCGIDLHSNNHVVVIIDDDDRRPVEKRLPNERSSSGLCV